MCAGACVAVFYVAVTVPGPDSCAWSHRCRSVWLDYAGHVSSAALGVCRCLGLFGVRGAGCQECPGVRVVLARDASRSAVPVVRLGGVEPTARHFAGTHRLQCTNRPRPWLCAESARPVRTLESHSAAARGLCHPPDSLRVHAGSLSLSYILLFETTP
jgi:hypothetical protein